VLRIGQTGIDPHSRPVALVQSDGRGFVLAGLALIGVVGLLGLLAGTRAVQASGRLAGKSAVAGVATLVYTSPTRTVPPGGPNNPVPGNAPPPAADPTNTAAPGEPSNPVPGSVRVSSAYTTGGILFDGGRVFDNDANTGWISDPTQPPEGQWIEWDTPPDSQLDEIWLNVYVSAMRYSRPQTSTLTAANGVTQVLTWKDTSQTQPLKLPTPVTGRVRLTINTVWGGSQTKQPVGIAALTLVMRQTAATPAAPLPSPPAITGPTSTAPGTVGAVPPPPDGNPAEPWRWWLVGVLVLLAGFFLVRGVRRQRRP
jgi:hypothetical protein